ncbi:MAG: hypothetical protein IT173_07580 [Acidobacteria bacterium]|nr:hypothetical protein [Acidobacteriota bacterium]
MNAETSLDFAEARMYANTYGRFTAVDPLLASGKSANPQTFNRYIYVLNNPLTLVDRTGTFPEFSFFVYFRTFAPFDWFGGFGTNAFMGDGKDRAFSTDLTGPNSSYRMAAVSSAIATDDGRTFKPVYTRALEGPISYDRWRNVAGKSECWVNGSGWFPQENFDSFDMWGNDDAVVDSEYFNPAWDIDMHPTWRTTYNERAGGSVEMNIAGGVTGDGFPAAEAFVTDGSGNGVMLGVYPVPPDGNGPEPERRLAGNGNNPMINFNLTILVSKGVFQGVVDPNDGHLISIADWNKRFTLQPTRQDDEEPD